MFMKTDFDLNELFEQRNELDLRKSRESLELISITETPINKLNVTIVNSGQVSSRITYIGESKEDPTPSKAIFYSEDIILKVGEIRYNITGDKIDYVDGETKNIIIITEYGNIFTFNYPLPPSNEIGGESKVIITGITSQTYNPISFNLLGSTNHLGGSVADLGINDGTYIAYTSYSSGAGTDLTEYVDNNDSDVDNSNDKGTHSSFAAQQDGPDSVSDILTEENTGPLNITQIDTESFEGSWPPTGWSETPSDNKWNRENDQFYDGAYSADFDGHPTLGTGNLETASMDMTDADAIYIDFWFYDEGCDDNEFLLQCYNGISWNNVADLGSLATTAQWIHYDQKITDSQYFVSNFCIRWVANGIDNAETAYVDLVTVKEEITTNYETDLEVQWTNIDFNLQNEVLAIYLTTGTSEDLQVDVWDGDSWEKVVTNLSAGWNNVSVSPYLTSSTFTIRFKGSQDSYDNVQDSWQVDATLLRLVSASNQEVNEIELVGTSNSEDWVDLVWQIDSSYNSSSVPVIIQLYDFDSDSYPTSGEGYLSYVTDATPDTDEWKNQSISLDPTSFRNDTGHWKLKIKEVKTSNNRIRLNLDWIEFKTRYVWAASTLDYDVWYLYRIKAVTYGNEEIKYGIASIYNTGNNVAMRDAVTKSGLSNPDWVYLDENGEYYLEIKSSDLDGDAFSLYVTVGSVIGEKSVTQTIP